VSGVIAVPLKFLDRNQKNYQGEYSFTVDTVNSGGVMIEVDTKVKREYNGDNDTVQTQQSEKEMSALSKDFNSKAVQQPTGGLGNIPTSDLLRLELHERNQSPPLEKESPKVGRELSSETDISKDRSLRNLQKEKTDRDTSQGREQIKQQYDKPTGDLSKLPYKTPPDEGKKVGLEETQEEQKRVFRIRRLTPLEAERLMSLTDDWTRYGIKPDGTQYELSDSARYRLCGNGVVVNVVKAIIGFL
jgi:site-specific DNA-cytosine methylase